MPKNKVLIYVFLTVLAITLGCASNDNITGQAIASEANIYEDAPQAEQQNMTEKDTEENQTDEQKIQIKTGEEYYNKATINEEPKETIDEFKFNPESIVSTQNNISLSIDNIKHEIKSEYWGKIIEITATVLNKGHGAFKPKLIALLYDEKDFKEEWLKPKAEIQFDIEQLNAGEHTTRQAFVSISFDDLYLAKNFKLVLVDAADPGNKPLVVAETNFEPLK